MDDTDTASLRELQMAVDTAWEKRRQDSSAISLSACLDAGQARDAAAGDALKPLLDELDRLRGVEEKAKAVVEAELRPFCKFCGWLFRRGAAIGMRDGKLICFACQEKPRA